MGFVGPYGVSLLRSNSDKQLSLHTHSCSFQPVSKAASLQSQWLAVWQLASRSITSVASCGTACHLLDVLMRRKIVQYATVGDGAEAIISSFDLNGPAILTESSSSLMITLLEGRLSEHPSGFYAAAERILHWLFSRWNPSMSMLQIYELKG